MPIITLPDGKIIDFWGTNFADVFKGDDGSTWVNAQGGDDVIVQNGSGSQYYDGGEGNDTLEIDTSFVNELKSGTIRI